MYIYTHTHAHTHRRTHTRTHTHTLSLSLSLTHTHIYVYKQTHKLSKTIHKLIIPRIRDSHILKSHNLEANRKKNARTIVVCVPRIWKVYHQVLLGHILGTNIVATVRTHDI